VRYETPPVCSTTPGQRRRTLETIIPISGFTFVRNAVELDYPIVESIRSILPIVNEFIVNVGDCTDSTLDVLMGIDDPKVRIIETEWNPDRFVKGATNADQTNIALDHCTNPWCFYLQADEVAHEEDFPRILEAINESAGRDDIDGLLFRYNHFWGSYDRVHRSHNWYDRDIRLVRNDPAIRSWKSAQSFRKNGEKLRVLDCRAWIYHYGWVRHPLVMRRKSRALDRLHHDREWVEKKYAGPEKPWDYGPLEKIPLFRGTHPAVMEKRIKEKDWKAEDFSDPDNPPDHEHLKFFPRFHSALERLLGRKIGGYSNWTLVK
jgi:glycosyltransferase involved in cell wall biosynthesis